MARRKIGKTLGILVQGVQKGMSHRGRCYGANGTSGEEYNRTTFMSPGAKSLPGKKVKWNKLVITTKCYTPW